ncbi:MAG: TetR/AcrR family transcriptional regulator [Pseudomonadota bacterium]
MPRPSLKTERTEEILEAFENCVARYGVEGSTLERIAEEAGLARALIRHNVGNKDELLDALVKRFLDKSQHDSVSFFESLPQRNRIRTLIDWLFNPTLGSAHDVRVASALIAAATDRPKLAKRLRVWTKDFIDSVERELRASYRCPSNEKIRAVAAGIVGIYFNVDSLAPLGNMAGIRSASKEAALLLISTLD